MDNRSEDKGEVGSRDLFRFLKCPSHLPGSRLTGGRGSGKWEARETFLKPLVKESHPIPKWMILVVAWGGALQ